MKRYSISQKLFRGYAGCFLLCFLILLGAAVWYIGFIIQQNMDNTREQLFDSMDANIENYFEQMNDFSREVMNSDVFKETAMVTLPEEYESGRNTSSAFSQMYQEAYEMIQKKYQIGVVLNQGYYIWMGSHYHIAAVDGSQLHTYDGLTRDETPHVFYLPYNEYLEASGSTEAGEAYVVLARSMDRNNRYLNGRAILEVMTTEEEFAENIEKAGGDGIARIHIYDTYGNAIYRETDLDLSEFLEKETGESGRKDGSFVYVHRIFDDRVSVIYTISALEYYDRLFSFLIVALLAGAGVLLLGSLLTYHISRQISKPISAMCGNVKKINVEQGVYYQGISTDTEELQVLSDSLNWMCVQLEESLQHIITLKDYENHAKMLALQAQMQPHFLFNTLTTIGSMAEEAGNDRISRMCMNLTQMFRYISGDAGDGVRMFEEIRHMERYVDIMKERFPNCEFRMDIPLEMMDIRIPKLTIQPLVENSFKYCNRQKPEITVQGRLSEDGVWIVEVEDNGKGFSMEKKEEILEKCREGLKREKTFSSQIDGMGLVNVFVRLSLFYGQDMIYDIEENKGKIVVGGRKK